MLRNPGVLVAVYTTNAGVLLLRERVKVEIREQSKVLVLIPIQSRWFSR